MNEALSLLIEAHSRWLSRHEEADAPEFLYHYDALACLWRVYNHQVEEGKRRDAQWDADYRATHGPEAGKALERLRAQLGQ